MVIYRRILYFFFIVKQTTFHVYNFIAIHFRIILNIHKTKQLPAKYLNPPKRGSFVLIELGSAILKSLEVKGLIRTICCHRSATRRIFQFLYFVRFSKNYIVTFGSVFC